MKTKNKQIECKLEKWKDLTPKEKDRLIFAGLFFESKTNNNTKLLIPTYAKVEGFLFIDNKKLSKYRVFDKKTKISLGDLINAFAKSVEEQMKKDKKELKKK